MDAAICATCSGECVRAFLPYGTSRSVGQISMRRAIAGVIWVVLMFWGRKLISEPVPARRPSLRLAVRSRVAIPRIGMLPVRIQARPPTAVGPLRPAAHLGPGGVCAHRGRGGGSCRRSAAAAHTGQQRGQNEPRWNKGRCIFSARPPHSMHGPLKVTD